MASALGPQSPWWLECLQCNRRVLNASDLRLAHVGLDGYHLALRPELEPQIDTIVEKKQHPKPARRKEAPFKMYCHGASCTNDIGVYQILEQRFFYVFSSKSVHFRSAVSGEEKKIRRWGREKTELEGMGVRVLRVDAIWQAISKETALEQGVGNPAKEMVYCNVERTSDEQVDKLVKDRPREYQKELFRQAMGGNSIVYLPTGSGKTLVATMVIGAMKKLNPDKMVAFLVHRIPLVYQQSQYIKKQIPRLRVEILAGDLTRFPGDREHWERVIRGISHKRIDVLVITAQIFFNFLVDENPPLKLSDVSCLVFDEAHHCRGNHVFAQIMHKFYASLGNRYKPLVLGLTASPAGALTMKDTREQLTALLSTLQARCIMPMLSNDLGQHWNNPKTEYVLRPLSLTQERLEGILVGYLESVCVKVEGLSDAKETLNKTPVTSPQFKSCLRTIIDRCHSRGEYLEGLALAQHAMNMFGVIELNRVLGPSHAHQALVNFLDSIDNIRSPMDMITKRLLSSLPTYKPFRDQITRFPKFENVASGRFMELLKIVRHFMNEVMKDNTSRAIVFVHMRRTCFKLCEELGKDAIIKEQLNPLACVGHGNGIDGMQWQGEQEVVITRFHEGECKLLVSTNVLEEGLDVPACNLVIRYDSRGTCLRALVQSRGRAARRSDSRFVIMCNDGEELIRYKDLAVKESNIEQAVREQVSTNHTTQASRYGCQKHSLGPEIPVVEKRKTNEDAISTVSKKPRTQKPPRRNPCVSITIHTRPNTSEISEATELLEKHFDIKTFRPEARTTRDHPTVEELNATLRTYLEVTAATENTEDEGNRKVKSRDEIFLDIVRKWCEEGPKGTWLERRGGRKKKIKGASVHPLFMSAVSVGDFKDRGTFVEDWNYACLPGAMVIFEHDVKNVTLAFQDHAEGSIFKVEFPYREIQDCIFLDTARPGASACTLFVPLRSVPRVFEAEGFHANASNDDEDNELLNLLEQGELFSDSDEDSPFEDDDNDGILGNDSSNAGPGDESSGQPSTEIIGKLKLVTKWKRLKQIKSARYGRNVGVFGNSLVLKLALPFNEALWDMLRTMGYYDRRVCYAAINTEANTAPVTPPAAGRIVNPKVQYAFECLTSRHPAVKHRVTQRFFQKLSELDAKKSVDALERITKLMEENYFVQPEATLEHLMQHCRSLGRRKLIVPENCVLIPRMVFTPTREIFFPPEIMQKNRVLRHFQHASFFCLQIRDEDFSRLATHAGNIAEILARLKILLDNPVRAGGRSYDFLGCSNSQLRSHSCWFVAPGVDHNATSIRQWMGDFSQIRCVATFMARMGQCFSTSTDTIAIIPEETGIQFEDIEDVTIDAADQTYTFSDGVGRISLNVTKKVCSYIDKPVPPSALQIRFAGYKGVLTTDTQMEDNRIHLRPSMRKFQSTHRQLEVLQTSRPQAVYLNHQTIMLLSNLGVSDEAFISHQQKMLDALAYMMTDEDEATQRLSSSIRTGVNYQSLYSVGVSLTTEPYFKSLLCALYREKIYGLLSKARILLPVSEARLMMGVMDETGVLRPGQVFVQYTEMKSEGEGDDRDIFVKNRKTVVKGRVAVTRNPCLHPGDVRQLEAVDFPELRHLVDCVVFPRRGPRPHPNEMAGGDLDGDLYFVCWGKDLLPRKPDFPPMNYKSPEKKKVDGTITLDHMTNFITEYITCDQLGIIDNTHKAQADTQESGVESAICLELSELHSLAVDAPKTGLWQEVPASARLREYPDFMMKSDKPSYPSQKVLGKLYRECRNFQESMNFKPPQRAGHVDARFLIRGFREYVDSARETLVEYTEHIETVLNLYGIQTEEELMSGCFYKLQKKLGRERQQIADVVRRLLVELRTIFRRAFFREFRRDHSPLTTSEVTSEMQKKASAWYYVSYQSNIPNTSERDPGDSEHHLKRVIGFPWIVDDVLVTIPLKSDRVPKQVPAKKNVHTALGNSLGEFFAEASAGLLKGYKERLGVKSAILNAFHQNSRNLGLVVFGSSATLSFEEESDIDLCVLHSNTLQSGGTLEKAGQLALLKKQDSTLRHLYNAVHLVHRAKVPIFRLAGFKHKEAPGAKLCVDLCANPDGFFKAMVITSYIHRYPALLPLLRMLIEWGRVSGLMRKVDGSRINTNLLVFMLLSFCVQNGWISEWGVDEIMEHVQGVANNSVTDAQLVDTWEKTLTHLKTNITAGSPDEASQEDDQMEISMGQNRECHLNLGTTPLGYALLEFFRNHQSILDKFPIPQRFVGLLGANEFQSLLGAGDARLLHEQMQRAYHILALHCDVTVLLEVCASEIQHTCHLTDQLSVWIAGSERYHSKMFSDKSGAKVRIRPRLPGLGPNLLLEASGTAVALQLLENLLDDKSADLITQPFSCIGLYFVSGANTMIFEGSQSDSDTVNLVPYYGRHHSPHDHLILHVPLLANPPPLTTNITSPEERSFRVFLEKFLQQMDVIARDYTRVVHGATLEFNVHFGRLYTFHVPRSLTEDTDPVTVKSLQISLKKGFESKAASIMSLGTDASGTGKLLRRPFTRRRRKPKKESEKNSEEKPGKKDEKQRAPKHSLFTNLPDDSVTRLSQFLERKGFREQADLGKPYILVTVNTDEGTEGNITYDSEVRPTSIRTTKLRWFVADVKRPWQQRTSHPEQAFAPDMINGLECDFRFIMRSFQRYAPSQVENLGHKKYFDILKPRAGAVAMAGNTPCPFQINLEMKSHLGIVRHHVQQKVFANSSSTHEFLGSTQITLDEVNEYSRLRPNGSFASVFKRFEMTLHPELPTNWTSHEVMERFAWNVWSLAFEIASEACQ